jgi:hypothetical protein
VSEDIFSTTMQKERQTDRQTDRDIQRETETQKQKTQAKNSSPTRFGKLKLEFQGTEVAGI